MKRTNTMECSRILLAAIGLSVCTALSGADVLTVESHAGQQGNSHEKLHMTAEASGKHSADRMHANLEQRADGQQTARHQETQMPQTQKATDKVTGRITTADGEPLAGAGVMIKGTGKGTTADIDGRFEMKAPEPGETYTLVFQYIGMQTREIEVSTQRTLNVRLEQDNELDGSVIVGAYGTRQSREDLTGSASR